MHRAHQLLQKHFLIIHPTADGNQTLPLRFDARLRGQTWRFILLSTSSSTEKVHFQHTAKLINHLISERANYTLQVRPLCPFKTGRRI